MLLCEKPTFILTKICITRNKQLWELQSFLTRYISVYAVKSCLKADIRNLLEYNNTFINKSASRGLPDADICACRFRWYRNNKVTDLS